LTGIRTLDVRGDAPSPSLLAEVGEHLREGGLVVHPTETVYGFGCALREAPIRRIQSLKGRGPDRPFLILVPSRESVGGLAWTEEAEELARVFWPGALTLVLRDPKGLFPVGIRSPRGSVALRVSPHPVASGLVDALGGPITSTSANQPGDRPALTADEARRTALSLGAYDDLWVLDAGPLDPSPPSTIIDVSGPRPVVSRIGAIPLNRLRCVLPEIHGPT
jgi:tRNA threonylcarbamoyl adenosine modification protein (Sua5/YciO/YrdC/YwlC family)